MLRIQGTSELIPVCPCILNPNTRTGVHTVVYQPLFLYPTEILNQLIR